MLERSDLGRRNDQKADQTSPGFCRKFGWEQSVTSGLETWSERFFVGLNIRNSNFLLDRSVKKYIRI
jgi:hypothetical protein